MIRMIIFKKLVLSLLHGKSWWEKVFKTNSNWSHQLFLVMKKRAETHSRVLTQFHHKQVSIWSLLFFPLILYSCSTTSILSFSQSLWHQLFRLPWNLQIWIAIFEFDEQHNFLSALRDVWRNDYDLVLRTKQTIKTKEEELWFSYSKTPSP